MEYFLKGVSRLKMRLKTVSNLQISLQIPDTLSHSGYLVGFSATYILREFSFRGLCSQNMLYSQSNHL